MSIVIIVNIITSVSLLLGGVCMKKYAKTPLDYSIGYKTKRSVSSREAWSFSNRKCGASWIFTGIIGFIAAIAGVFLFGSDDISAYVQIAVLAAQITAIIITAIVIEKQLKLNFNESDFRSCPDRTEETNACKKNNPVP